MIRHSVVPSQFRFGFIIPLVKDHQGDKTSTGNYRGITISPIFSKVFDHLLRICFSDFLSSSEWQFGFKAKHSMVQAVHCLKEAINCYTSRGSNGYCAFLDASNWSIRVCFINLLRGIFQNVLLISLPLGTVVCTVVSNGMIALVSGSRSLREFVKVVYSHQFFIPSI
jgi:hypothetical protein